MRRVLTSALIAAVIFGCSVEAPEYRPTAAPLASASAVSKPDVLPLTYDVSPLDPQPLPGSATKTLLSFSTPNSFVLDWSMPVRLKSSDGPNVRAQRLGTR